MSVNQVDKQTGDTSRIAGGTLYADAPIGAILAFGGATAPAGWLLCQGQAISRTTYAALFAVIGTAYGAGDGSTTFNLPDPREAALVGAGTNALNAGSIAAHNAVNLGAFQDDQFQSHAHHVYINNDPNYPVLSNKNLKADGEDYWNVNPSGTYPIVASTEYEGNRAGTTTHGKQLGVNYIIKAQQVGLPLDIQSEVDKKLDKFYLDKSGIDLDDCTEAGLYEINTSVENMPTGADGGNMLVSHNPTSGAIVQTYFATNGTIASRYKINSAAWTSWINPFTNRPVLQYAKNVQYTSDAAGNIVFANSLNNVVIVSVRVRGNYTWSEGYSDSAGCYIHLMDPYGQTLTNATVYLDVIYYPYDWTAA